MLASPMLSHEGRQIPGDRGAGCPRALPGGMVTQVVRGPPEGPEHSAVQGPNGGSFVVCSVFPFVVCCGVVGIVGGCVENGIVEGKGVWNEPWVSFKTCA